MFSHSVSLARSASRSSLQTYIVFFAGHDKPKMRVPMTFWMAIVQLQMNCNRSGIIRSLNLNQNNYLHARNDSVEVRRAARNACSQPTDQLFKCKYTCTRSEDCFCLAKWNNISMESRDIAFLCAHNFLANQNFQEQMDSCQFHVRFPLSLHKHTT